MFMDKIFVKLLINSEQKIECEDCNITFLKNKKKL